MNTANALFFAALGLAMELLPRVFPGWFSHVEADCACARVLWLEVMGVVQMGLGLSYIVRTHLIPLTERILSPVPDADAEVLALSSSRGVARR